MADSFFKSYFTNRTTKPPEKIGGSFFYPLNSSSIFGAISPLQYYATVPELNAVLNIRARAMASGIMDVVSKVTGLPIPNSQPIAKIIRTPNWFQSQIEFWRQSSLFRDIYGNEFLYFTNPVGVSKLLGIYTLDPSLIKVEYKQESPYFSELTNDSVKYIYKLSNGQSIQLDKSNLIHLNDSRVQKANILLGTSRIEALRLPLDNIISAYRKRNIILNTPVSIMSNDQGDAIGTAIPMRAKEKQEAQDHFTTHGADPIITNMKVKNDIININARSMGLFEETREDTAKICDAFSVPYELLASQKGTTFTNLKEAKRQMYSEGIVPDMDERVGAINQYIESGTKTYEVIDSFKHLPVFSEDLKERAETLNLLTTALDRALASGVITVEQYKIELQKFNLAL